MLLVLGVWEWIEMIWNEMKEEWEEWSPDQISNRWTILIMNNKKLIAIRAFIIKRGEKSNETTAVIYEIQLDLMMDICMF